MAPSKQLRGFRMEKEKDKKVQSSMLRYVRQSESKVRIVFGSTLKKRETEHDTNLDPSDSPPDEAGSSTSPNRLEDQPPLPQSSKLFYVKPLSEGEKDFEKNRPTAKESGFDISPLLKESTPRYSFNGNHSEESNHEDNNSFGGISEDSYSKSESICNVNKRLRIVSEDEENGHERAMKRPCLSDEESLDSPRNERKPVQKFDPDMIEKLLDTYCELYPNIDRMEIFDSMEKWNYNFSEMTKSLDLMVKQQKLKNKEQSRVIDQEEKRQMRMEERERQRRKKQVEMQKKKVIWKMKARFHEQENDEDEEEDYIGKMKVYESDSSEEEGACGEEGEEAEEGVTSARAMVVEFFNDCPTSELSSLPGCTKKKTDIILGCRPFENWRDLVCKFKSEKHISTNLLNKAKDILQMRNVIKNLMKKCERISSEIQSFVSEVITGDESSAMKEQPKIISPEMKLKNYQLVGLNWLALMHDQQLNGVLADEMGLGKTVQAIAFLAYLKERGELEHKQCLVVVPASTLDNWARELSVWTPSLGFLAYHGSQDERKGMRLDILNGDTEENVCVILTTYNIVTSSPEDRAFLKKIPLHTVIFDEAHMLKNMTSQRYENLMKIRCVRRLLLTGTPLQNNLLELMSILIFVMPKLFEGRKEELKKVFSMFPRNEPEESRGRYERERILQAKRIMAPFFLRRLKQDVLKDLPAKCDEVIMVPMCKRQEDMYKSTVQVLSKRAEQIKEELENMKFQDLEEMTEVQAVDITKDKSNKKPIQGEDSSSNMLMKLRKLANHPLLIRCLYTDDKITEMAKILKRSTHQESILEYIIEDFSIMSDFEIHRTCESLKPISKFKLEPDIIVQSGKIEKLDKMLPEMKNNGDRILIFSQFVIVLNVLEEYMKIRNYEYRRLDGGTPVSERQEMIDDFNEDESIFIFLLSTRAGGLGINLSAANTVILHDIDFNPYNDKQAEDRCHRVGQTRTVKVYRLISENSIEEGMRQIANDKLQLEKDVTGSSGEHRKCDVVALLKTALRVTNSD